MAYNAIVLFNLAQKINFQKANKMNQSLNSALILWIFFKEIF